jgi:hypothetical protein
LWTRDGDTVAFRAAAKCDGICPAMIALLGNVSVHHAGRDEDRGGCSQENEQNNPGEMSTRT